MEDSDKKQEKFLKQRRILKVKDLPRCPIFWGGWVVRLQKEVEEEEKIEEQKEE